MAMRSHRTKRLVSVLVMAGSTASAPVTADRTETVSLRSEGWRLAGSWLASERGEASPAVLLLHRAAGSRQEYRELAFELARRGVASLALDLRGHGESTNLGRFEPPYAENLHINENADRDVVVALEWLASRDDVDPSRLAVVGASYSGEAAARALRTHARAVRAAVMLSPGNFSGESIAAIDPRQTQWVFIRTVEESPAALPHIDDLFKALEERAPEAELWVLEGAGHGTRIFESHPELTVTLADWIAESLLADPRGN